jgi:hypothetical protein
MIMVWAVLAVCAIVGILDSIMCNPGAFMAGLFVISLIIIILVLCVSISWWCLIPGLMLLGVMTG